MKYLLIILLITLSSCTVFMKKRKSNGVTYYGTESGWKTKKQIKEHKNEKTNIVDTNVIDYHYK